MILNTGVNPTGMAITKDGRYLYVANNNKYDIPDLDSVTIFDLNENRIFRTIYHSSFNRPNSITISNCRQIAYVTNSNTPLTQGGKGVITKISTQTHQVIGVIESIDLDGPSGMVIYKKYGFVNNYGGPGGVGQGYGNSISIINLTKGQVIRTFQCLLAPSAMTISNDRLYVTCYSDGLKGSGSLSIYDISNKTEVLIKSLYGLFGPSSITVDHVDQLAYITNFGHRDLLPFGTTISVVDTDKIDIISEIEIGIQPSSVALTKDRKHLVAICYNTLPYGKKGIIPGNGSIIFIKLSSKKIKPVTQVVGLSPISLVISPNDSISYVSNQMGNTLSIVRIPEDSLIKKLT